MALLEVKGLEVTFPDRHGALQALRRVDFHVEKGERLGIVGESGAGKSMAAFALLGLVSEPGYISAGEVWFEGRDLVKLPRRELRDIRGHRISMIFQDPNMTLNPVMTIGQQMVETLHAHQDISDAEAKRRSIEKLREVAIPSPAARFDSYPHELSGGLRQRVVIAIALLTDPALIVADEPTTALDVTIQAEIMALILELCEQHGVGLILITHDLAVVAQVTQRMVVMYAGQVVESGKTRDLIERPRHPYTQGLIKALPQQNEPGARLHQIPGNMPTLDAIPDGCSFHPRCPFAQDRCRTEWPQLRRVAGREVACHRAESPEVVAGADS
ncbi:MAG: ABC transporter ATP-binding protein [Halofilum sp. (in: g-proteobacteria)]|nr:ABC transporter ATP-binding protein [Halofilum sp. (in: g-proteobacteria)]